jgi:hypothetical protein
MSRPPGTACAGRPQASPVELKGAEPTRGAYDFIRGIAHLMKASTNGTLAATPIATAAVAGAWLFGLARANLAVDIRRERIRLSADKRAWERAAREGLRGCGRCCFRLGRLLTRAVSAWDRREIPGRRWDSIVNDASILSPSPRAPAPSLRSRTQHGGATRVPGHGAECGGPPRSVLL